MNYDQTLIDLFNETVKKYFNKTAVIFLGRKMSYGELDELSNQFADFLFRKGVRHGDRVSLLVPNCPQQIISFWGTLKIGGVVAPMNPLVSVEEIRAMAKQADPKLLVTAENFSAANQVLSEDLQNKDPVLMVKLDDYMPCIVRAGYKLKNLRQRFFMPAGALQWDEVVGFNIYKSSNFERWMDRHEESVRMDERLKNEPNKKVEPRDLAVLQFTGGTTGTPKAAMLTHRNIVSNTLQALKHINKEEIVIDDQTVFLGVIPFFHVYGLSVCLNMAFAVGATVVLLPRFDSKMVFSAIAKNKVNIFPGIPRMYAKLVEVAEKNPAKYRAMCSSLKYCVSGAGALNGEVREQMEEMLGVKMVEGYGLSETSPIVSVNPMNGGKAGSLGTVVPDTEVKIVDGELWVRGPQVMRGYWRNEKETAEMFRKDGWLATGDMAHWDKDGFLWMDDRKKDMIKIRGENVYTKEIEEVIIKHNAVIDVAVVGMPDKKLGEKIVACVVIGNGKVFSELEKSKDLTIEGSVQAFCREQGLANYKIPQEVVTVPEIPKTIIGKILKRELRKMLAGKNQNPV